MPSPKPAAPLKTAGTPTPDGLRALLAHLLAGATGGPEARWRDLVGAVEALPIVFHPRSNWRIEPTGTAEELEAIGKAAQLVRNAHPYVTKQVSDVA